MSALAWLGTAMGRNGIAAAIATVSHATGVKPLRVMLMYSHAQAPAAKPSSAAVHQPPR